jgi:hypothetical protein
MCGRRVVAALKAIRTCHPALDGRRLAPFAPVLPLLPALLDLLHHPLVDCVGFLFVELRLVHARNLPIPV